MSWLGSRRHSAAAMVVLAASLVVSGFAWATVETRNNRASHRDTRHGLVNRSVARRADASGPSLPSVDSNTLAQAGLILHPPSVATPPISSQRAEAIASDAGYSARALEAVLADCSLVQQVPAVTETCWVVAKDPTGLLSSGPAGAPRRQARYAVTVVDANTGDFVTEIQGF